MYPSLGRAPLFGAIFSDDFSLYECSMRKAVQRLNYIAQIHNSRTNYLRSDAIPRCANIYSIASFSNFITLKHDELTGQAGGDDSVSQKVTTLFSDVNALKNVNINAVRGSCTTIY